MKVCDAMSSRPVTVGPDATIVDAIRIMLDASVSGLPVVDSGGVLVGIVTEGDFMRRGELDTERHRPKWLEFLIGPGREALEYASSHGRKVGEVMSREPVTIDADAGLDQAVDLMLGHHFKRLPVMRDGRMVGILSRADMMRALLDRMPQREGSADSDAKLQRRIAAEMDRLPWAPRATVQVAVNAGAVELRGVLLDDRLRAALVVLVENIPGVRNVRDRLTTIEPVSGMVVRTPAG